MYFLDRGKSISHLILPRKKKFKTKNRKKQIDCQRDSEIRSHTIRVGYP